jgi:prepilin-type N-terminal cleavage/methylation domain-containing protein
MNIRPHLLRASSPVGTSSTSSTTTRRAFSLIEIMVGVALISVIIVGLLAMFYQVQRAFRAGTAQADIMEGGRATMNLIVRDLQEMTASGVDLVTNCLVTASFGAMPTSQDLVSRNQPRPNFQHDLCFLSRNNDDWTGTAYRLSNSVSGVGTLYRLVTNSVAETLPLNQMLVISNMSGLLRACTFNSVNHNTNFARVLEGVVSLTITPYDTNGVIHADNNPNVARVLPPLKPQATDAFDRTNAFIHVINPDFYAFFSNALPAYLDIELAVLEPATLTRFNAQWEIDEPTGIPTRATNYLARHIGQTHIFRQRVAIRPSSTEISSR